MAPVVTEEVETCHAHSGIEARVVVLEEKWEKRREELIRVWQEIENRVTQKLFYIFLSILVGILGSIFIAQISISTNMAVIKTEVAHINQLQTAEQKIIETIKELHK